MLDSLHEYAAVCQVLKKQGKRRAGAALDCFASLAMTGKAPINRETVD
jgi:hypothetical protein